MVHSSHMHAEQACRCCCSVLPAMPSWQLSSLYVAAVLVGPQPALVPAAWLPQAPQFTSPHWILGIACPLQQIEAGLDQGAFVALAQQPLQQVRWDGVAWVANIRHLIAVPLLSST